MWVSWFCSRLSLVPSFVYSPDDVLDFDAFFMPPLVMSVTSPCPVHRYLILRSPFPARSIINLLAVVYLIRDLYLRTLERPLPARPLEGEIQPLFTYRIKTFATAYNPPPQNIPPPPPFLPVVSCLLCVVKFWFLCVVIASIPFLIKQELVSSRFSPLFLLDWLTPSSLPRQW